MGLKQSHGYTCIFVPKPTLVDTLNSSILIFYFSCRCLLRLPLSILEYKFNCYTHVLIYEASVLMYSKVSL